MKLIAAAIMLSSLGAAKANFWASALPAPIDGYEITIPEWEVEVSPGGPFIKLNGTVQEVHSELLRHNPDWDSQYPTNITKESPSLNKREFVSAGLNCGGRWAATDLDRINEGIDYLERIQHLPSLGPGPSTCSRISCSYNAAIYWCNDDHVGKTLQGGFIEIAVGTALLVDVCVHHLTDGNVVSGQIFDVTNWNIIVRFDDC